MAKKKENTKQRYRKGGPARLDMREGGRVSFTRAGKVRREKRREERKQRRIDKRNARKSKSGEESGIRESLPAPGDIASEKEGWYPGKNIKEWREGRKEDKELSQTMDDLASRSEEGPLGSEPPQTQTTGQRGVSNLPGPSGFDTYTAGPGSSPQQTAPGEPGIGSTGVDVNPNAPGTPTPPPSDGVAPVMPPSPPSAPPVITPPIAPLDDDWWDDWDAGIIDEDKDEPTYITQDIKAPEGTGLDEEGRKERIARSSERIERAARGELPVGVPIPDAEKVGYQRDEKGELILDEDGNPIKLADAVTKVIEDSDEFDAEAGTAVAEDQVVAQAGPSKVVDDPTAKLAETYDATQGSEDVLFDPATGTIKEEDTAELGEKALTFLADGVDFTQEQKDRGLVDRVVGTLDPEAKAQAQKVAGADSMRVLRAVRQLRRAGLSEDIINELKADPDALEARLSDFTEAERGMIAGLPEQALVTTQMNTLLEGMESGEIPAFARPAVAAVNQMLAARGLDASTVGRDALFNAVIQAAMPLAQSNAQSIKDSIFQERDISAQQERVNAQMAQQTALSNADKTFNLNMAQFNADQQQELTNKKFLQTTSLTEVSNDQQAVLQQAVSQTQLDLANLNTQERLAVQNAQAFLNMNLTNLSNEQQGNVLTAQQEQQRMLTNQAADNAGKQFNASSQNQRDQFMTGLATQVDLNNAARNDAMGQFNTQQTNAARAADENRAADVSKFNAQMETSIDQFNAQQNFQRVQWNTANAQAVEQANTQWRRQANTINTAAQNAINQQNAQNAFQLSAQAQSFLWQELRDQADYNFKGVQAEKQRKASLAIAALGNDSLVYKGRNVGTALSAALGAINNFQYGSGSTSYYDIDEDLDDVDVGGG